MGGKAAIAAGLFTGLVAGAFVVGGVVVMAPGPVAPSKAPIAEATASPSPSVAPSPSVSASPVAPSLPPSLAPSLAPSASAGPSPGATSAAEAFGIGEPAPPLTVLQLGGGVIDLSALKGTPVWVNFMATWCPPCRDELPVMKGFAARYADSGLVVIAVDVKEDEAVVDAFARELRLTFPVGLDTDGTAQSDWGAVALPVHFWIDAEGIVRDGALGGIGPDIMAEGLRTILPGVEVTP